MQRPLGWQEGLVPGTMHVTSAPPSPRPDLEPPVCSCSHWASCPPPGSLYACMALPSSFPACPHPHHCWEDSTAHRATYWLPPPHLSSRTRACWYLKVPGTQQPRSHCLVNPGPSPPPVNPGPSSPVLSQPLSGLPNVRRSISRARVLVLRCSELSSSQALQAAGPWEEQSLICKWGH